MKSVFETQADKLLVEVFEFRKENAEDRSAFWYRKDMKHPLLKGLHIIVEEKKISVWCKSPDVKGEVMIIKERLTLKKFYEVLKWASNSK